MQALFDYALDRRVQDFLPAGFDHLCAGLVEHLETSFTDMLSEPQKDQWKRWYTAMQDYTLLYERALFQAAFAMGRELSR